MAAAIAIGGYIEFKFLLSTEERETEWLKRVGTPARLELGLTEGAAGVVTMVEAVRAIKPGSDITIMLYIDRDGGRSRSLAGTDKAREQFYDSIVQQMRRGLIREYKRFICFDHDVLANNHELQSGILRIGEGPGTVDKTVGEHCRMMLETPRCSVDVAPVFMRTLAIGLYGEDKVSMSVETVDRETGDRSLLGVMYFHDPPNGEIIEQFRQIERATERRMVAVHKVVFPENMSARAQAGTM